MASLVVEKEAETPGRDILIVFDIDETLIQFINKGPYPFGRVYQKNTNGLLIII